MEKFSNLTYQRPDMKKFKKDITELLFRFQSAHTYDEAKSCFFEFQTVMSEIDTMATLASIRNTLDTTDKFYETELNYINTSLSKMSVLMKDINRAFIKSRFRHDFELDIGTQFFKILEADERALSKATIPLDIKENKICMDYKKSAASCKTDFRGEECNFYGLLKHMQSTDRAERKEAFEAWAKLYESVSPALDKQYDKLFKIRRAQASKLGFESYPKLTYNNSHHFDYTPADIAAFRAEIVKYVVPAAEKLFEAQRKRLGVDKLRYYDEALAFPDGDALPSADKDLMVESAKKMYSELSPETAEFFGFMTEYELFDLDTRPGKHLGGYCTKLEKYNAPFIFSNFNGTSADVDVLTHEAGHAFQAYLSGKAQQVSQYAFSTSDISEIHSMSMELFTYPWMDNFFGDSTARYKFAHLADTIKAIPYLTAVDEFQHKVFESEKTSASERRAIWHEVEKKYLPWRDYDGNAFLEKGGFWMQKQHIFLYPFYYIDYALAQFGAFEFYLRSFEDRESAWNDYVKLCSLGGSLGYRELLRAAGLSDPFALGTVKRITEQILGEIEKLESAL